MAPIRHRLRRQFTESLSAVQGKLRQRPQGARHVQQRRIRADVHCEVEGGAAQGGLARAGRHAVLAQVRAEGVTQGVHGAGPHDEDGRRESPITTGSPGSQTYVRGLRSP